MAELGALLGGRYRLDQVLGQGGMATIFRATDGKLGREVAVKVLRPEFGADAQFVERFEHEAQAAASLSHPNIVGVYDYGTDSAGPYIVMEQVSGGDLASALGKKGSLPPTAVANMGQQVADALAAAHAAGLVHRDIKPSNILLSPDGRVQVADFGIAQAAAGSPVTATGITLGSVLYFSPEQARGDTATAASDIYSLGLVMYEMLTGQRAFSGDSPAAVAVARLSGGVPSPMAVRAEVPPALDAIVRWCLAVDPSVRPAASELSTALARFRTDPSGAAAMAAAGVAAGAAGPPGLAPAPGPMHPPTQTAYLAGAPAATDAEHTGSGPWTWLAAGLGLLVIVASGILLFLLFSGIGDERPTPNATPEPTVALVETPEFIGRREANALSLADRRGLVLEIAYHETDEVEAERVIEQLPEAGTQVEAGTTVQITVATQVETVVVPDVSGIKEDRRHHPARGIGPVRGPAVHGPGRAAGGLRRLHRPSRRLLGHPRHHRGLHGLARPWQRPHAEAGSDAIGQARPDHQTHSRGHASTHAVPISRGRIGGRVHLPRARHRPRPARGQGSARWCYLSRSGAGRDLGRSRPAAQGQRDGSTRHQGRSDARRSAGTMSGRLSRPCTAIGV